MKRIILLLLLCSSFSIKAQISSEEFEKHQKSMEKFYPGDISLTDFITDVFNKNPDNKVIKVELTVKLVEDSTILVKDKSTVDNRLHDLGRMPGMKKGVEVTIPYRYDNFVTENKSDSIVDFAMFISESGSRYTIDEGQLAEKNNGWYGCNGYGVGTIYKFTEAGTCGYFEYTYECKNIGPNSIGWVNKGFKYLPGHWCDEP
ncbi:hypothetical protein [Marinicella rhabdoformis]|uniref:hypothetical protein n=1 Tax=Marinicella rhabdoformis TaxID=2580566 RepID=UPI0012AEDEF5|nr:hypothetical protein [Marinicella rhabdoformis]